MKVWRNRLIYFGLLWLRVLMGIGIATHGYSKIFVHGVGKFAENVSRMGFPIPIFFAWLAALSEFLGGILLVLGLGTRIAAFFVFLTMTVAVFVAHGGDPFSKKELALSYWVMASTLVFTGAPFFSLDELLSWLRSKQK